MRILVVGAKGRTGAEVVSCALNAGHEVTVLAHDAAHVPARHERLRIVDGDVMRPECVVTAMQRQQAVISALDPPAGALADSTVSEGTQNIMRAMSVSGVMRLVVQSGLMVGSGHGMNLVKRVFIAACRAAHGRLYEDKARTESLVRESNLDWTIVRPPRLKCSPARGGYRVGRDLDVDILAGITHADAAAFLVQAAATGTYRGQILNISY
ncbi:NAD(P)-dependent oxidoreductase [Caenimonas aquaedulcis]|uniref:NAD(P)H-binding protein n=1 Tax=Caenimonas aquaedulcis TaxID=2793270 RepID=A0A931H548_9BURK|nr:NAD(P)H-binding protein [Caenimonas aquaedulcis]